MDSVLDFVKSDVGTGIAWLCTVGSVLYSVVKRRENKLLLQQIQVIKNNIRVDESQDTVTQNGEKSVYTKNNSGGMDIKM